MALEKVLVLQDEDSLEWYVVPEWMKREFYMLLDLAAELDGDFTEFDNTFSKYKITKSFNPELYADLTINK